MPDRVEADGVDAKRFLGALRDILEIPKDELDKKLRREKQKRQRRGGSKKTKSDNSQPQAGR